MKKLMSFIQEEDGITAIEYALIATGIAVAISVTVFLVGGQLNSFFETISSLLASETT
jgi:pilus assembly protein Flp/PilA